jgi:Serine dehydrogenase proteinase
MTNDRGAEFPRGTALPSQSPLFWVQQKDRYLRQLLIRDIEDLTGRRLLVYFANRFKPEAQITAGDIPYFAELFGDVGTDPVDLFLETSGGQTDATESIVSLIQSSVKDLRVVVPNSAKSNGTVICLAGNEIVMGPTSELGPIDPSIQGIPCTILAEEQIKASNYPLHRMGVLGILQTKKLAKSLLMHGMMAGIDETRIDQTVSSLASRDVFFSHGSVIDHREAASLGLRVTFLDGNDEIWRRLWLLYCTHMYDVERNSFLKVFEGRARSTSLKAATP